MRHFADRERDGSVENVCLDEMTVLAALQRKHVPPSGIHHNHLGIASFVQTAEAHDELVVVGIEVGTQQVVGLTVVCLIAVKLFVVVTDSHIQAHLGNLCGKERQGIEDSRAVPDIRQYAQLLVIVHDHRAVAQVLIHRTLELPGLHLFLLTLLFCLFSFSLRFLLLFRLSLLLSLFSIGLYFLLAQHEKFLAPIWRQVHHHLIETIDGRVLFPVQ